MYSILHFQVKGHKYVYQFLCIPYETEGSQRAVESSCTTTSTSLLAGCTEFNVTDSDTVASDCSEKVIGQRERTADSRDTTVEYQESTECNRERTEDNSEPKEESFDTWNGYRSRAASSSRYSVSSCDSTESLDELQAAEIINTILSTIGK